MGTLRPRAGSDADGERRRRSSRHGARSLGSVGTLGGSLRAQARGSVVLRLPIFSTSSPPSSWCCSLGRLIQMTFKQAAGVGVELGVQLVVFQDQVQGPFRQAVFFYLLGGCI